jgi:hypothetical protein
MAKAQDPPSPVDAYGAPLPPTPAGGPTPPQYAATPEYQLGPTTHAPAQYTAPRPTNTLAIIALIASCAGAFIPLADVAGVVMGFIALSQIKRTGEAGHGMALAAVIVGFALFFIELLVIVGYFIFIFWIVGVAGSAANYGNYSVG